MAREIGRTGQSRVRQDDVAKYGLGAPGADMGGRDPRVYPGAQSASRVAMNNPATSDVSGPVGPVTPMKARTPLAGVTGTISPSPASPTTPVGRAFKQGFDAGKGGGTGHGGGTSQARPKAAVAAKPKAKASVAPKTSERPKPRPKATAPKAEGLLSKVGKALAANKANIQKKAVDRMKASGRKG